MQQFPVGLTGSAEYVSARTPYSQGDLFVILTDGIVEVANRRGEEFGLDNVEKLVIGHAAEPLADIWDAIRTGAMEHGLQQDDQSALLVRAREY
jgi:serine phosphatase RsbU (regulator of sigma subunit)